MPKYTVTCVWTETGYVDVDAENEAEARQKAIDGPLPTNGEYLEDSFEVDDVAELSPEDA